MKNVLMLAILLFGSVAFAQKAVLITSKAEIEAKAKEEIDKSSKEGEIKEFALEHQIKGEYYFDLTVGDKKKVVTVFAIGNDSDNIKSQNALRDFMKEFTFSTFKVPKDKRYKFEYTFFFE